MVERAQQHKLQRVATREAGWVEEMEAKAQQQPQQQGKGRWGMPSFHSLIDSILGNLQLVLTNVHVRYEDDGWAWAGHRLAAGLLLNRVAAHTVDENGRPAFVTTDVLQLLRKVCYPSTLLVG